MNKIVELATKRTRKLRKISKLKDDFRGINEEDELSISTQPKEHSSSICSQDKEDILNKEIVPQESIKNLYVTRLIFT